MNSSVLIVGDVTDPHVASVRKHLGQLGAHAFCVDIWEPTSRSSLAITSKHGEATLDICPSDLRGVWWRTKPRVQTGLTEAGAFKLRERREFLLGLARLSGTTNLLNDPVRQDAARNKIVQLHAAANVGLRIPRTLISSDPIQIASFLAELRGPGIYKPLSWLTSADGKVLFTNLITHENIMGCQAAISEAPGIYQEYVEKRCEYRITLLDDQIFCARIYSQEKPEAKIDWRRDQMNLHYETCDCPTPLDRQLRALTADLGLRFAAMDVIEDCIGHHVFLEANPAGNWLWLEERLQLPISASIALALYDS